MTTLGDPATWLTEVPSFPCTSEAVLDAKSRHDDLFH